MGGSATICLLLLSYGAVGATAQQPADPIDSCPQVTNPSERLACFDRESQKRRAAMSPSVNAVVQKPPTTVASPAEISAVVKSKSDDTIGLDGRQLDIKRKEEGIQPARAAPITAAISRLTSRPGQYYFELDNGQVWQSTDTVPQLFLAPHETVLIRPGVLGAFFLKTQAGLSIRVHRVH
jgi:hypothetical protein